MGIFSLKGIMQSKQAIYFSSNLHWTGNLFSY